MSFTVYLVGPISGLSFDECYNHFNIRKEKLESFGYNVLHPMLGKEFTRTDFSMRENGYNHPLSTNHAIVQTDFWRVDQSNILFADFTLAPKIVSIGTVSEISRAFSKGKHIITVLPDDNIHRHAFILEMSSVVFKTIDEAFEYFKNIS